MAASCNSLWYMLKDVLLCLYSRKELSFCHSCYTQTSLLQLLKHQLVYIVLVWLNKVKRLSIAFHLQRKGGSTQLAVSFAQPPSLQDFAIIWKVFKKNYKRLGPVTFGTLFVYFTLTLIMHLQCLNVLQTKTYTEVSEITWSRSSLSLTAGNFSLSGSRPKLQCRGIQQKCKGALSSPTACWSE